MSSGGRPDVKSAALAIAGAAVATAGVGWAAARLYFEGRRRRSGEPPIVWGWQYARQALKDNPDEFLRSVQEKYGDVFTLRLDRATYSTYVLDPACFTNVLCSKGLLFAPASRNSKRRFGIVEMLATDKQVKALSIAMRTAMQSSHLADTTVHMQLLMRQNMRRAFPTDEAWRSLLGSVEKLMMVANAAAIFGSGWDVEQLPTMFHEFNQHLGFRLAGETAGDTVGLDCTEFLRTITSPSEAGKRKDVSEIFTCVEEFLAGNGAGETDREGVFVMLLWGALINSTSVAFWTLCDVFRSDSLPEILRTFERVKPRGPDGTFTMEQMQGELTVLWGLVQETLRLRSKPNNYRRAGEDLELPTEGSHKVREGDWVSLYPRVWHLSEEAFPDPHVWKWDRFLQPTEGDQGLRVTKSTMRNITYRGVPIKKPVFAFGGGDGLCPGETYATMLLMSMLSEVLRSRTIEIEAEAQIVQDSGGLSSVPWPCKEVMCKSGEALGAAASLRLRRQSSSTSVGEAISDPGSPFSRESSPVFSRESSPVLARILEEEDDEDVEAAQVDLCSKAAKAGKKRVAICGASSSGMIMAKELLEAGGFEVVLFERKGDVGGVYSSDAAYKGSRLTGSCSIVCFGCVPSGEEECPNYWEIPKYARYLESFASRFGLRQLIRFKTSVRRAFPLDVSDASGNELVGVTSGPVGDMEAPGKFEVFHHFICCTGITAAGCHPSPLPQWNGRTRFQGKMLHANSFRCADGFKGKRVLIVGLGESGSDIALLLCKAGAAAVCIQSRSGPGYVVPREVLGRAADLDTNRVYHGIPWWLWDRFGWRSLKLMLETFYRSKSDNPDVLSFMSSVNDDVGHNPKRRFGTKSESFCKAVVEHGAVYKQSDIWCFTPNGVTFVDHTEFECDTVIYCGGYAVRFPIFDQDDPGSDGPAGAAQSLSSIATPSRTAGATPCASPPSARMIKGVLPRQLYKRIVHPGMGLRFTWVGFFRPGFGAIPPVAEMQARLLTQWLSGKAKLPSASAMERSIKRDEAIDMEQYGKDAQRIVALGDFSKWMNDYADLIGCQPALTRLFFTDPRLWWHVLLGQLNGMQFRLRGPGATKDSRAAILSMPMMPAPVLLVELCVATVCKVLSLMGISSFRLIGL